ncbi:hypothetical protein JW998_10200, partial [candidate division KSB1 bacterium]|nr:hypothetical protein [candidate division KSB1 bacterium]
MSYEAKMLYELEMPSREDVEQALLISLFKHGGVIKEFGSTEEIVSELADYFNLTERQRSAYLETIYRKENRLKKSSLWHRLLFRAADSLAREKLITRPTQTIKLIDKKGWMLTENGIDEAIKILNIPEYQKDKLTTKTYEVQRIAQKLKEAHQPKNYNPIDVGWFTLLDDYRVEISSEIDSIPSHYGKIFECPFLTITDNHRRI